MDLRPIKTKKIYEEIVSQITELINHGGLSPGDRLLPERELADRLRVGRSSVREALRALELMGLVEIRAGEGAFVREVSTDAVIQPLAALLAIKRGTFHHVYEVRRIMETAAAYLAAERAAVEELEQMREALVQMEQDLDNNCLGDVADNQFHLAVAAATHNPFLLSLRYAITDAIHQVVHSARRKLFETPGNAQKLLEQHRAIYLAIKEGDNEAAESLMYHHLIFAEGEMAKEIPDRSQVKNQT